MKKLILSVIILTLALGLFSAQVNLVGATTSNLHLTNPITTPITYYQITGQVIYRFKNWFRPGSGVTITLVDLSNNQISTVVTDTSGNYSFSESNGSYQISASDNRGTSFQPISYMVTVADSNILNINFKGIITR